MHQCYNLNLVISFQVDGNQMVGTQYIDMILFLKLMILNLNTFMQ